MMTMTTLRPWTAVALLTWSLASSHALAGLPEIPAACNGRPVVSGGTIAPAVVPQTVSGAATAAFSSGYTVEADAESTYTFSLCAEGASATYDTWICLFDGEGNLIAQSDDSCALRSEIEIELEAGEYTLAVSGFSSRAGDFDLVYFREAVIACGDKPVVPAGTIIPTLAPQTVQGTVDGNSAAGHHVVIDVDGLCAFTLCSDGGTANFDSRLCLFDADRNLVAENDNFCGTLSRLSLDLTAGEYTLAVSSTGAGVGSYTVAYSCQRTFDCGARVLGRATEDLVPSSSARFVTGSVSLFAGTFYRIVQRSAGTCRFGFCAEGGSANFDTLLCLFDATGRLISQNDDFCGRRSEIRGIDLEAGTYFIAVSGSRVSSGTYRLSYSCDVPLDCAGRDVVPTGTTLAPTPTAQAVSARLEVEEAISYAIDLGYKGLCRFGFCEAPGSADLSAALCLFDSSGRLLARGRDGCGGPEEIEIELASGEYLLAVSAPRGESGAYSLAYSAEPDRECSGHAILPASRQLTAGPVARTVRGGVTAAMAATYDVSIDFDGTCGFTFCGDGGGADFDTALCLFDARGMLVAGNDNQCGDLSELVIDLRRGRYELVVSGAPGAEGTYTLEYSCTPPGAVCAGRPVEPSGEAVSPLPLPGVIEGSLPAAAAVSYRVEVPFVGYCTLGFCSDGGNAAFDASLCLFDAAGEVVAEAVECEGGAQIAAQLLAGAYSVAISAPPGQSGEYALAYRCLPPCDARPTLPGGEVLSPGSERRVLEGELPGEAGLAYPVEVESPGLVTMTFCADEGEAGFIASLCLLDSGGALLASNDDTCGELAEISLCLQAGTYVLIVSGHEPGGGAFRLVYEWEPGCGGACPVPRGGIEPAPEYRTVSGELAPATADVYSFSLEEESVFIATFCRDGGLAEFVTFLCLRSADGSIGTETGGGCDRGAEIEELLGPGDYTISVAWSEGVSGGYTLAFRATTGEAARFLRGDCNGDGAVDVSDAITTLRALSLADGAFGCEDACDSNDDGEVNVADAVNTLGVLFLEQGTIPPPETCDEDPTEDDVGCETPASCP